MEKVSNLSSLFPSNVVVDLNIQQLVYDATNNCKDMDFLKTLRAEIQKFPSSEPAPSLQVPSLNAFAILKNIFTAVVTLTLKFELDQDLPSIQQYDYVQFIVEYVKLVNYLVKKVISHNTILATW